jgi:ParB family chromosome partitioning protein
VSKSTIPPKLPGRANLKRRSRIGASAFGDLVDSGRLRTVALDAIAPNPHQPRTHFDEDKLAGLASSIGERGVLQPPVVREVGETYELVAGERRWRAARLAGLTEIEVLVGDHDDSASLVDAVMENLAREDLSPVESARAYATMIDDLGLTREEVGRRIGQSRVSVSNHLRLLDLPEPVLELLDRGELTFAHGRALLLVDDHATRLRLARQAVTDGWSTRRLEHEARAAGAPRARPRAAVSADAEAFAQRAGDALSQATGLDLRARVSASGAVTLTLSDQAALRALAVKLGAPAEALDEPTAPRAGTRARDVAPAR